MTKQVRLDTLLLFLMALAVIDGGVFNFVPVTFPAFSREFGVGLEQMGRSQFFLFAATLTFSVIGGWFVTALGTRRAAAAALSGLAAAFLGIATGSNFNAVMAAIVLFGISLAAIEVVGGAAITENFGETRQRTFFLWGLMNALGATLFPAALGWWLVLPGETFGGWRAAYLAGAAGFVALAAFSLLLRPAAHEKQKHGRGDHAWKHLPLVLSSRAIYGLALIMFLHGVAQVGMTSWVGQLYIKRTGANAAQAALFLSLNAAGFFAGRVLLTWITSRWRLHELLVLALSAGGGTLAFVATLASPNYLAGLVTFTLAGVFISGDGPSANSYTGLRYPHQAATAFAVMNGLGNVGGAIGAYIVGLLGSRVGLDRGIWFLPIFSMALSIFAAFWYRLDSVGRAMQAKSGAGESLERCST